jgi:hypothetical protein
MSRILWSGRLIPEIPDIRDVVRRTEEEQEAEDSNRGEANDWVLRLM